PMNRAALLGVVAVMAAALIAVLLWQGSTAEGPDIGTGEDSPQAAQEEAVGQPGGGVDEQAAQGAVQSDAPPKETGAGSAIDEYLAGLPVMPPGRELVEAPEIGPDPEKLRERRKWLDGLDPVLRHYESYNEESSREAARQAARLLPMVEQLLAEEKNEERRYELLGWYSGLASLQHADRTPAVVVELALHGPYRGDRRLGGDWDWRDATRTSAIHTLGVIGDDVAVDTLIQILESIDRNDPLQYQLLQAALTSAGSAQSPRLARALERLAEKRGVPPQVDVLGDIGDPGSAAVVRPFAEKEGRDPEEVVESIQSRNMHGTYYKSASEALTKIEAMAAPDRDERLLELVRSQGAVPNLGGVKSEEVRWWAVERIARLDLGHLAGPMRQIYEEEKRRLDTPALVRERELRPGRDEGWVIEYPNEPFHDRWLDTLYRLGAELSATEIDYLAIHGRLH
ncbi:MAG: hypothetical protein HY720_27810, partial [Planctomycetes bacterium]|nr:hypothetical protein [Planctomycetota bacterium]